MPLQNVKEGTVIFQQGAPLDSIAFVLKGQVLAKKGSYELPLDKGSALGLPDITTLRHSFEYTAASDVSLFTYTYSSLSSLTAILRENADVGHLMIDSACYQMKELLDHYMYLKSSSEALYILSSESLSEYNNLCQTENISAKEISGVGNIAPLTVDDSTNAGSFEYYAEINELEAAVKKAFFYKHINISMNFLERTADVFKNCLEFDNEYTAYIDSLLSSTLGKGSLIDSLFEAAEFLLSSRKSARSVLALMMRIFEALHDKKFVDAALYEEKFSQYNKLLPEAAAVEAEDNAGDWSDLNSEIKLNLVDSAQKIIEYAGVSEEEGNQFLTLLAALKKCGDINSGNDNIRKLRKDITNAYYQLYYPSMLRAIKQNDADSVIKMFLNFGYVDAELAGIDNADYLFSISDAIRSNVKNSVYTLLDWMSAIYNLKKDPSKNEFDMDYPAYLRDERVRGGITEADEKAMLNDPESRLKFEFNNMVKNVSRMSFGRITTFCPIFCAANTQKEPRKIIVTPGQISGVLDDARAADYTAFYRDTIYANPQVEIAKEIISVEVLPDFILFPIVGLRGVMWQEIDGKKRTTPSRMMLPMFLMTELTTAMLRMMGQFKWEMCRRTQGARWNDVTDPSLTSEYCDYLQFYKQNKEISSEIKEKIKDELSRAKNSYREVFINNYLDWMTYEINGSTRLNRYARRLQLTYSPFPREVRERLAQNPQFAEPLQKFDLKQKQNSARLGRVIQKVKASGKPVPQELTDQLDYMTR